MLVDLWKELGSKLPHGWESAAIHLELADPGTSELAAQLLTPAQPFATGTATLRFRTAHDGSAPSFDGIQRLLSRLDERKIAGTLSVVETAAGTRAAEPAQMTLVASWEAELAHLPGDWSDVFAEIELTSTDDIDRVSLLCVPLNPRRDGMRAALQFRTSARFGYGASTSMVHRCFERCDNDGIPGSVKVLRALSDTRPIGTQGPVWLTDGRNF
ncbi:MAG TPA: hypothetical protein VGL84_08215 [Gaiellaceae bacterium]